MTTLLIRALVALLLTLVLAGLWLQGGGAGLGGAVAPGTDRRAVVCESPP